MSTTPLIHKNEIIFYQEKHHVKRPFTEEYRKILDDFGIEYDKRYIFHELELDASLRDATIAHGVTNSTERCIPNGMQKVDCN